MTVYWSKAACRPETGVDPELFFPVADETSEQGVRQVQEAKAVCQSCPIMSDCLRWALDTGQEFGVWGGASESERRKLLRTGAQRSLVLTGTPPL